MGRGNSTFGFWDDAEGNVIGEIMWKQTIRKRKGSGRNWNGNVTRGRTGDQKKKGKGMHRSVGRGGTRISRFSTTTRGESSESLKGRGKSKWCKKNGEGKANGRLTFKRRGLNNRWGSVAVGSTKGSIKCRLKQTRRGTAKRNKTAPVI